VKLSSIVPWGRSLNEYTDMFSLTGHDLEQKILGCSDGPASFNAQLTSMGGDVVSADPIYAFDSDQIRSRIEEAYPEIMQQVSMHMDNYIWKRIPDAESLGRVRMEAMNIFLQDYVAGKATGRYIQASLPALPFDDRIFELALCSHYLFLYSDHVDADQHVLAMKELCRVANEVRVFPLLSLSDNRISPHLEVVMEALGRDNIETTLVTVDYEFKKGATQMLVAKRL
jgi:aromatic ring-cleaving dioxygenase